MKPAPRIIQRLLRPALIRLARAFPAEDAWQRNEHLVFRRQFGRGCNHEWSWYFERHSTVSVKSVKELCRWLSQCTYAHDTDLFNEKDFWQHPVTFEVTRRGDCEDHALWAWRKLTELGLYAEFVGGRRWEGEKLHETKHAAVIFEEHSRRYLLDGTAKQEGTVLVLPIHKARELFCPQFSVDSAFKTYRYGGTLLAFQADCQDNANESQSPRSKVRRLLRSPRRPRNRRRVDRQNA